MDKNYLYYNNREKYKNICIPRREDILNYLIKEKFLSEFSTEEEKQRVLDNLGITRIVLLLAAILNEKAFRNELDNYALLSELNKYITLSEFLRRIEALKPKDEKAKGYYSSYEALIAEHPGGETGDWAIVNVDGDWYIYKYTSGTGWELSETYDNSIDLSEYAKLIDLELFQRTLISGENIKTINGRSILGSGDIEIRGFEEGEEYATKQDLSEYMSKEEWYNILNPLRVNVSINPNLSEYTGSPKLITITAQAVKGGRDINEGVTYLISYNNVTETFDGTYVALISTKGTTTFTVTCNYKSEEDIKRVSVNLVLPTYIGFDNTSIKNLVNLSKLDKKVKDNISMTETIENTIAGSYLWIISPFTLLYVATDPGFTYRVAIASEGNMNGLNYYRSNSAIDVSNLTYYIK